MEKILVDIREESKQIKRIFENKDLISIKDLLSKIEELDDDKEYLEDKIRDMEQDIEDNYKPISKSEQFE